MMIKVITIIIIFSQTGQIHDPFKNLLKEQIRQYLIAFEGQAKPSKIKSVMMYWSKCISMVIAKTASPNPCLHVNLTTF